MRRALSLLGCRGHKINSDMDKEEDNQVKQTQNWECEKLTEYQSEEAKQEKAYFCTYNKNNTKRFLIMYSQIQF